MSRFNPNRALVPIPEQALAEVLRNGMDLPNGYEFTGRAMLDYERMSLVVEVTGPDLPETPPGAVAPYLWLTQVQVTRWGCLPLASAPGIVND